MVARVTLRKAKTYNLGGKRWIKDVPQLVRGEEAVKEFENNGYFRVHILRDGSSEAKKAKKTLKRQKAATKTRSSKSKSSSKKSKDKKKKTKKKAKGKSGKLKK